VYRPKGKTEKISSASGSPEASLLAPASSRSCLERFSCPCPSHAPNVPSRSVQERTDWHISDMRVDPVRHVSPSGHIHVKAVVIERFRGVAVDCRLLGCHCLRVCSMSLKRFKSGFISYNRGIIF